MLLNLTAWALRAGQRFCLSPSLRALLYPFKCQPGISFLIGVSKIALWFSTKGNGRTARDEECEFIHKREGRPEKASLETRLSAPDGVQLPHLTDGQTQSRGARRPAQLTQR